MEATIFMLNFSRWGCIELFFLLAEFNEIYVITSLYHLISLLFVASLFAPLFRHAMLQKEILQFYLSGVHSCR